MAKQNNVLLEGRNIYRDKRGTAIYYKKNSKRAYRIKHEDEGTFKNLNARYLYGILLFIFTYFLLKFNLIICIAISLAGIGFMEWRFHKFLSNCTIIENYTPSEESNTSLSMKSSFGNLIMRSVLYILLGILLIINAYSSKDLNGNTQLQVISDIVGIISIFFGFRYISIIIKKKSLNSK